MGLLQELANRFMSPVEDLFCDPKKRIEASVGFPPTEDDFGYSWDIRPAETMYGGTIGLTMGIVDAASLHTQRIAQANLGLNLPDIRFRVITTGVDYDGYAGTHFGTLTGATKLAQKRFDQGLRIIDGSARSIILSAELSSPK